MAMTLTGRAFVDFVKLWFKSGVQRLSLIGLTSDKDHSHETTSDGYPTIQHGVMHAAAEVCIWLKPIRNRTGS
jgi:hypothetical protein